MTVKLVRTWLPVTIIVAGLIVAIATGFSETGLEGGALLVSAGLSVWLINLLYRIGVRGDRERDVEDRARAYFAEHGHWPDEDGPSDQRTKGSEPVDSGDGQRRRR
jgi:hypothetical protein